MNIKQTTISLAALVLCAFLALSYLLSKYVILEGFEKIEDEQIEADMYRAVNALDEVVVYLDRLLVDWAYWDDAYRFAVDRNPAFVESNLTVETLVKQKIAFVAFFDAGGEKIWGNMVDAENGVFTPLSEALAAELASGSPLALPDKKDDVAKGLLVLDGDRFLVSSRRILDSDGKKAPHGVCIMGKRLDRALIEDLGRGSRLDMDLREAASPGSGEPEQRMEKSADTITATKTLRDIHGEPVLSMVVKDDRSVMLLGRKTFRLNFLCVLYSGVGLGAVFLVVLEVRILRRIRSLRTRADAISREKLTGGRMLIDGRDEIADLAANINAMLDTIEADDVFLQQTFNAIQAGVVLISPDDRRIVDINPFALEQLGLSRHEVVGKVCHGFICPQEMGHCPIADAKQKEDLSVRTLLTGDGTSRSILKSVSRVRRGSQPLLLETFVDVTELQNARQALQASEERYRTVFMNTGTASVLVGEDTVIQLANMEFFKLSGFTREEVENRMRFHTFFDPDQVERVLQFHYQRRVNPKFAPREYESVIVDRSGGRRNVHMTVAMIEGTDMSIVSMLDITERIHAEKQLAHQAAHDSLTGLPNRLLLHDRIQHAIQSAADKGTLVGVLLLDLDRFKQVNDSFGHGFGDSLIGHVARRLVDSVHANDTVSRIGGDEFVILMDSPKSPLALAQAANQILNTFKAPFSVGEQSIYLGVSIGVTSYPQDGDSPEALIKNADLAMYRSKEMGRNTYSLFTRELNDQAISRMALETELHLALENDRYFVVYQPKVDAATGLVVGCEALIRWRNSAGEVVSPAQFIPVAEEMDLVVRLDAFVLRRACGQVKAWHEMGHGELTLAVNISARNFTSDTVVSRIAAVLEETGFPPDRLEIELTETALMANWDRASEAITRLAAMGIGVSLDDFGTGYSSLYSLQRLPISCLKIDKRFVDGIVSDDSDGAALVKTIIALAANLRIGTVAEGVETGRQLAYLLRNGCRVIQGYLFSPPVAAEAFAALLAGPVAPAQAEDPDSAG